MAAGVLRVQRLGRERTMTSSPGKVPPQSLHRADIVLAAGLLAVLLAATLYWHDKNTDFQTGDSTILMCLAMQVGDALHLYAQGGDPAIVTRYHPETITWVRLPLGLYFSGAVTYLFGKNLYSLFAL